MRLRTLLLVAGLLAAASPSLAQTVVTQGPVTTAFQWEVVPGNNLSAADAMTFEFRVRDSRQVGVVTALTGMVCAGTPVTCRSNLTPANVDALNIIGVHDLTVAIFRQDVGESPQSAPFVLRSPAGAPTSLRITR